jgi:hypothetical protein
MPEHPIDRLPRHERGVQDSSEREGGAETLGRRVVVVARVAGQKPVPMPMPMPMPVAMAAIVVAPFVVRLMMMVVAA